MGLMMHDLDSAIKGIRGEVAESEARQLVEFNRRLKQQVDALTAKIDALNQKVHLRFEEEAERLSVDEAILKSQSAAGVRKETPEENLQCGASHKVAPAPDTESENSKAPVTTPIDGNTQASLESSYKLQSSIWDTSFLIFTKDVGPAASWFTLFFIGFNSTLQFLFASVIMSISSGIQRFDAEFDGYSSWRRSIAHSVQHMDAITEVSLARRVCTADHSLDSSFAQRTVVRQSRAYLARFEVFGIQFDIGMGSLMTFISTTLWIITIMKEIEQAFVLMRATMNIPRGPTVVKDNKFVQVTSRRVIGVMSVQILRLGIAFYILGAGCFFILSAIEIGDIILKAVPLRFVLSIDELLYSAFAPALINKVWFGLMFPPEYF